MSGMRLSDLNKETTHLLTRIILRASHICVARWCTGCTCTPRAEKKILWGR